MDDELDDEPFERITPLPEGGPWTFIEIGRGMASPNHFVASTESLRLEIEIDPSTKQADLKAIEVQKSFAKEDRLKSEDLRRVAVDRLVRTAVAAAARPLPEGETGGPSLLSAIITGNPAEEVDFFLAQSNKHRKRKRRTITDDFLREVATVYADALQEGRPPKQAVSDELNGSYPTAGRWVSEARKRGILPPTSPGKASG